MTCPATFYRNHCEQPQGHPGPHSADTGAGTQTIWTDNANDPPQPAYRDDDVTVYYGDCLNILPTLPDNSIDAVVTDPPYALAFMGRSWDTHATPSEYQTWCTTWATECQRVLKPGGHLLAFGGTRTSHRLTCAVEDAGFEIRDSIAWLYFSGFPKSLDVSKAIDKAASAQREVLSTERSPFRMADPHIGNTYMSTQTGDTRTVDANGYIVRKITAPSTDAAKQWQGWGTALKPAYEPITVARKPLQGTVAANVQQYGTGALNIDACRIAHASDADLATSQAKNPGREDTVTSDVYGASRPQQSVNTAGRWPPNVALDQHTAAELDKQTGTTKDGTAVLRNHKPDTGGYGGKLGAVTDSAYCGYGGEGGGSRFFPTFKYQPKAPGTDRPSSDGIAHPTVKPVELIQWLIRLVTPPGGTILDPFAGTGTTAEAAIKEHKHTILIEREETYMPLIVARLSQPMEIGFNFD
jgi:site-specific DNA-methyltransferase (adenine-specific)